MRILICIISVFAMLGVSSALAAGDDVGVSTGGSTGALGYTCTNNADNDEIGPRCDCGGVEDCRRMAEDGVCGEREIDDTECYDFADMCVCTWRQSARPAVERRPEAHDGETNTAPSEEIIRPRENEVVPARRGRNPADNAAPAQEAEEDEEEPNRTARDHR